MSVLRITYINSKGSTGGFTHPLPLKIQPSDLPSIESFVVTFVLKLNPANVPVSWHFVDDPTEHPITFKGVPPPKLNLKGPTLQQKPSTTPSKKQLQTQSLEETKRLATEQRYLVKYHDSSSTDTFRQEKTEWIDEVRMKELKSSNSISNLRILAENVDGKMVDASERVRTPGDIQVANKQKRLAKQYEVKKIKRRQLHNTPGLVMYIETDDQASSDAIYAYMQKHNIPHLFTGKNTIWFTSGIQMEYGLESADENEVVVAKQYLSQFDPNTVKFMEIDKQ